MQLSTRARYAVMAMAELAGRDPGCQLTLAEIAARQQLSQCYLEQLFAGLRRAGLVASARGPGGGYRLARPMEQLAIADIVDAVGEQLDVAGAEEQPACCTHALWDELSAQIRLFLGGITLADVVQRRVGGRAAAPIPA